MRGWGPALGEASHGADVPAAWLRPLLAGRWDVTARGRAPKGMAFVLSVLFYLE